MNAKQFQQQRDHALRILKDVEPRSWHDVLLSSTNPNNAVEEAWKLVKIASCFRQFKHEFPEVDLPLWQEAYAVLRAAYDNHYFPPRRHLTKHQFERLLEFHLYNY